MASLDCDDCRRKFHICDCAVENMMAVQKRAERAEAESAALRSIIQDMQDATTNTKLEHFERLARIAWIAMNALGPRTTSGKPEAEK